MIITSFGLGIAIGFIFFELTGLTAGGIIVPGYIALFIEEPRILASTLAVSLLVYGIGLAIGNISILYGRRRFLVFIMLGFILKMIAEQLSPFLTTFGAEIQVIGYIIPGLIANEFARQGVLKTILAMGIVSLIVYFILKILFHSF